MKAIGVFRFHNRWEVCQNHLDLFRSMNPGVPVYGIFGGAAQDFAESSRQLTGLAHNWRIPTDDATWKWKHFDLVLKAWFAEVGHRVEFDRLYLIEWDFVLFQSLEDGYRAVPDEAAAFTALVPLAQVEHRWYWTTGKRSEWDDLTRLVADRYSVRGPYWAVQCPGLALPRAFLEGMASVELPPLCNDEARFPLYALILGIPMADTGFQRKWYSVWDRLFFNCTKWEIRRPFIGISLWLPWGRRAFHPVTKPVRLPRGRRR